jgi:hypothetical protein
MSVSPFPAQGRHFHGWTQVAADQDGVSFDLLIQPRAGSRVGAAVFSVEAIRRNGRWVVDRWYTTATFTPVGAKHAQVIGPNDFQAPGPGSGHADHAVLGGTWLIVPAVFFAVGLLSVVLVLGRGWMRFRRHALGSGGRTPRRRAWGRRLRV